MLLTVTVTVWADAVTVVPRFRETVPLTCPATPLGVISSRALPLFNVAPIDPTPRKMWTSEAATWTIVWPLEVARWNEKAPLMVWPSTETLSGLATDPSSASTDPGENWTVMAIPLPSPNWNPVGMPMKVTTAERVPLTPALEIVSALVPVVVMLSPATPGEPMNSVASDTASEVTPADEEKLRSPVSDCPSTVTETPVPVTATPGARPPAVAPVVLTASAKAPLTLTPGMVTATVALSVPNRPLPEPVVPVPAPSMVKLPWPPVTVTKLVTPLPRPRLTLLALSV